ncbi:hypothetical protein BJ742DRAFT_819703 [Cladochytrium replicatum]|nr:hypothetical protein BJ742DRAFT_819703 [Cladochytrium replicatum]
MLARHGLLPLAFVQLAWIKLAMAGFTMSTIGNTLSFTAADSTLSAGYVTGAGITPLAATSLSVYATASLGSGTGVMYLMDNVAYASWSSAVPFPDQPQSYILAQTVLPNSPVTASTSLSVAAGKAPYLFFVYCPTGLNPSGCGPIDVHGGAAFFPYILPSQTPSPGSNGGNSGGSGGSGGGTSGGGGGSSSGLGLGAIIGIAAVAVVVAVGAVVAVYIFGIRRKSRANFQQQQQPQFPQQPPAPTTYLGPPPPQYAVPHQQAYPPQPQSYGYDPRASYMPPPGPPYAGADPKMYDGRASWMPPPNSLNMSASSGTTAQQHSSELVPQPSVSNASSVPTPAPQGVLMNAYDNNVYISLPGQPDHTSRT